MLCTQCQTDSSRLPEISMTTSEPLFVILLLLRIRSTRVPIRWCVTEFLEPSNRCLGRCLRSYLFIHPMAISVVCFLIFVISGSSSKIFLMRWSGLWFDVFRILRMKSNVNFPVWSQIFFEWFRILLKAGLRFEYYFSGT